MSDVPYSFGQARKAAEAASRAQQAAEDALRAAARDAAEAERAYRQALSETILRLRADGMAATTCADVARGDKRCAELKYARDVADGVREAAVHGAWRRAADRRSTELLCTWSMRRQMADLAGPEPEPDNPVVFGARAA